MDTDTHKEDAEREGSDSKRRYVPPNSEFDSKIGDFGPTFKLDDPRFPASNTPQDVDWS